jgi:uncharacterized membrane protein
MQIKETMQNISTQLQPTKASLMTDQQRRANDSQDTLMVRMMSGILQGGVIISSALILIGMLLLPSRPGGLTAQRVMTFPHTLEQIYVGLLSFHPQALIVLGLLLLIATPVLRVAISIITFGIERNRHYVVITLLLLTILIVSFLLGKGAA